MLVPPRVKFATLGIAKGETPIDTGNLRYNATKLTNVKKNSWTIKFSTMDAKYIPFLVEGTKFREPNDFVYRSAKLIESYLRQYYSGENPSLSNLKKMLSVMNNRESNAQRRFRHRESIMNYYSKQ